MRNLFAILASLAVGFPLFAGEYSASQITTSLLGGASVTTPKINQDAVIEEKILTGAVTTTKLADWAVGTSAKLVDSVVTTNKLAPGAVTVSKVADGAITTAKIGDGAITTSKMHSDVTASFAGTPASSMTRVADGSTTQTTYLTAFATVTATMNNVSFMACLTGALENTTTGADCSWSILVDGGFPTGTYLSSTVGIDGAIGRTTVNFFSAGGCRMIPSQGSGSKSFALTVAARGTGTCDWGAMTGASYDTTFGIFEIR